VSLLARLSGRTGAASEPAVSYLDRWIRPLSVALLVIAAIYVWDVAQGPPYVLPLTDLGRDLIGAEASRIGVSPYQTVGDLSAHLPEWDVSPHALDHWVAHSPYSIAAARAWFLAFGAHSEVVFRIVIWAGLAFTTIWLGFRVAARFTVYHGIAVGSLVATMVGVAPDIWYLHASSVGAALLIGVYHLERANRRVAALLLLGLTVAWKPWLAPLALFLPHREKVLHDAAIVGTTAVVANLFGLAWIGGLPVLGDWLFTAYPNNFHDVEHWPLNLSVVGSFISSTYSTVLFVGVTAIAAGLTRFVPRERWWLLGTLTIVVASPLVWPHYWLNLIPIIVLSFRRASYPWLLLLMLFWSSNVAGTSRVVMQSCAVLAVLILVREVVLADRAESRMTAAPT
jgi:hypothetical protein